MKRVYMHGCGNRFFVADAMGMELSDIEIETAYRSLNGEMQVDGVLFLTGRDGRLQMNYFDINRQNGELARASMCGNGIRCIARFAKDLGYADSNRFQIETDDGVKDILVKDGLVSVNMGMPQDYRKLSDTDYYVHVGLPHYVRFTDHLDINRTRKEGSILRDDKMLLKKLGNPKDILHFNSVRIDNDQEISILTREGGVEDVTLACGTGSTASAYVSHMAQSLRFPITVHNTGGDLVINKTRNDQILMAGPAEYS